MMGSFLIWETCGNTVAQKSPIWESEDEVLSEDERVSSTGSRENNVCNCALHVIGLYGVWRQGLSFTGALGALGACEGIKLSHCPGHVVPGNPRGLVVWLMPPRGLLSLQGMPFSRRGRAVIAKERDVVRGDRSRKESATGPLKSERACWCPSFPNFCRGVNTLCLFGMSASFRFKRAVVLCL